MQDNYSKAFFSEIKISIADYYSNVQQIEVKNIVLKKTIIRPFSLVVFVEVRCDEGIVDLVAKKVVHHEINKHITSSQNQAVVEFNILRDLYPHFVDIPSCSVPRPILVDSAIEAYVMEYVPGDLLVDLFKFCRYFAPQSEMKKIIEVWRNCGQWLKKFQEFTGIYATDDQEFIDGVIARAQQRLSLINNLNDSRVPEDFMDVVSKSLYRQLERLGGQRILVSGRHGDFIPLNMIVNKEGITVIDFLGYRHEPIAVDVLKVLVCLYDEMRSVTASSHRVELLTEAFLDGYGPLPSQPYPLLYLCECMQRIVSLWGNLCKKSSLLHHRIEVSSRVKSHVDWLMTEGDVELMWKS